MSEIPSSNYTHPDLLKKERNELRRGIRTGDIKPKLSFRERLSRLKNRVFNKKDASSTYNQPSKAYLEAKKRYQISSSKIPDTSNYPEQYKDLTNTPSKIDPKKSATRAVSRLKKSINNGDNIAEPNIPVIAKPSKEGSIDIRITYAKREPSTPIRNTPPVIPGYPEQGNKNVDAIAVAVKRPEAPSMDQVKVDDTTSDQVVIETDFEKYKESIEKQVRQLLGSLYINDYFKTMSPNEQISLLKEIENIVQAHFFSYRKNNGYTEENVLDIISYKTNSLREASIRAARRKEYFDKLTRRASQSRYVSVRKGGDRLPAERIFTSFVHSEPGFNPESILSLNDEDIRFKVEQATARSLINIREMKAYTPPQNSIFAEMNYHQAIPQILKTIRSAKFNYDVHLLDNDQLILFNKIISDRVHQMRLTLKEFNGATLETAAAWFADKFKNKWVVEAFTIAKKSSFKLNSQERDKYIQIPVKSFESSYSKIFRDSLRENGLDPSDFTRKIAEIYHVLENELDISGREYMSLSRYQLYTSYIVPRAVRNQILEYLKYNYKPKNDSSNTTKETNSKQNTTQTSEPPTESIDIPTGVTWEQTITGINDAFERTGVNFGNNRNSPTGPAIEVSASTLPTNADLN